MENNETLDRAILLLEDPNLVWSNDFETIRPFLWGLLRQERKSLGTYPVTYELANELVTEFENQFH